MRSFVSLAAALAITTPLAAFAAEGGTTPAPENASVYFIAPADGATVSNPVNVVFGLKGMGVAPAGVEHEETGHHHLIVDAPLPPLDEAISKDEHYRHFGGGQTETTLELAPGEHTLQLLLGDHNHIPHARAILSPVITVTVK